MPSRSACSSSCGLANGPCRRDTVVRNYRYAALSSDFSLTTIRGSLCSRKPTPNRHPPRGEGGGNLEPCVCYFNLVDRRSYLQDGCPIPHRIDDRAGDRERIEASKRATAPPFKDCTLFCLRGRSGSLECRLFARLMLRWALLCCCPSICFALTSLQRPLAFSPVRPRFLRTSRDRKSTRLNSSHPSISYAVFCLKKKIIRQI